MKSGSVFTLFSFSELSYTSSFQKFGGILGTHMSVIVPDVFTMAAVCGKNHTVGVHTTLKGATLRGAEGSARDSLEIT